MGQLTEALVFYGSGIGIAGKFAGIPFQGFLWDYLRLHAVADNCGLSLNMDLPDDKPVSVPLRVIVIPLDRPLLDGSSNLPGS
jgi:hypothetical protein